METSTYTLKGITKEAWSEVKQLSNSFSDITFSFRKYSTHKTGGLKYGNRINAIMSIQGHIQDVLSFSNKIKHIIHNELHCFECTIK